MDRVRWWSLWGLPDEVRKMDNKKCLVFIKGYDPVLDDKYRTYEKEEFKRATAMGPYKHHLITDEMIEESRQPELADQYDYYNVPAIYVGDRKLYEAKPFDSYDVIKENLQAALDVALEG